MCATMKSDFDVHCTRILGADATIAVDTGLMPTGRWYPLFELNPGTRMRRLGSGFSVTLNVCAGKWIHLSRPAWYGTSRFFCR